MKTGRREPSSLKVPCRPSDEGGAGGAGGSAPPNAGAYGTDPGFANEDDELPHPPPNGGFGGGGSVL